MGTLKFHGKKSITIKVKGVYFCEHARSTLLSIGAFQKANARFQVSNNFDTINLLSHSGKLLIHSVFDPRSNSWPLPHPIRIPSSFHHDVLDSCNLNLNNPIAMNSLFKLLNMIENSQFSWNPEELTAVWN
jgi:hypothetical protein